MLLLINQVSQTKNAAFSYTKMTVKSKLTLDFFSFCGSLPKPLGFKSSGRLPGLTGSGAVMSVTSSTADTAAFETGPQAASHRFTALKVIYVQKVTLIILHCNWKTEISTTDVRGQPYIYGKNKKNKTRDNTTVEHSRESSDSSPFIPWKHHIYKHHPESVFLKTSHQNFTL